MSRGTTAVLCVVALVVPYRAALPEDLERGSAAETLTLQQALAAALEDSYAVAAAELQVRRAEEELSAARTRRLPRLELQAQATRLLTPIEITFPAGAFGVYPGTGPIPARDTVIESGQEPAGRLTATAAQPLTQLHQIGLGVKASRLARDLESQRLRSQRAAVAYEVRRLYYAILQLQSAAEAAHRQAEALRDLDQEVGRQIAVEAALAQDALDVKARLAAQEYRVVSLENTLATAREQLNVLLGRDPRTPFGVAAVEPARAEELDLQEARRRAVERRPELKQAALQVELADTQRRLKKGERIPELSLAVSYDSFFNVQLLPRNLAQVGLQLRWEPFDWGRRDREVAARTLAVDQARHARRDQLHAVLADVDRAFRKVQESKALLAARRAGYEGAQERVRVVHLRQGAQAALARELLQAQAALAEARAQHDEAELSLWLARAELARATGEDM